MNFSEKKAPKARKKISKKKTTISKTSHSGADAGKPKKTIKKKFAGKKVTKKSVPLRKKSQGGGRSGSNKRGDRNRVRVIPLGGVEEVGRNMIVIEIGHDIFISDVGFEFVPENEAPGIDYFLPNTKYLEDRKKRIKGVFITHAHLDHVGGIPFIMDRIGNPPIFTRPLSAQLIKKRQEEFTGSPKLKIKIVELNTRLRVGNTHISTFPVTHSIPDSMGIKFETPQGNIVISGDLKLDHHDGVPTEAEQENYRNLGSEKNLVFIADSTNAEKPGFSVTEREVQENLEKIIRDAKQRLIIGAFASQLSRIIKIITVAEECKRKVVLEGRSIRNNVEIAMNLGLLKPDAGVVISAAEAAKVPASQTIILATGAQGEEYAALNRMAQGMHKDIKLSPKDVIVFSSSVIPGNELAVQALKDRLYHFGLKLVHYRTSDVHSSGHGNAGELVWINQQVNAKFFIPGYGFRSMTHSHAEAVIEAGFPRKNVALAENGTVIDFVEGKMVVHKKKVAAAKVPVEGGTVSEIPPELIEERLSLASSGMIMVVVTVDRKTGKLMKVPDVVTVGFNYGKGAREGTQAIKKLAQQSVQRIAARKTAQKSHQLRTMLVDRVGNFIDKQTGKRPVIIPVVVEL